jgi:hypothetical protein
MTTQPERVRKPWDVILTIILLVLYAGWTIVCATAGALVALVSDSCGAAAVCSDDQIGVAVLVGTAGPVVLGVIILAVTVLRMLRRRLAFFVPLIGSVLSTAIVAAAYVTALNAVTPIG